MDTGAPPHAASASFKALLICLWPPEGSRTNCSGKHKKELFVYPADTLWSERNASSPSAHLMKVQYSLFKPQFGFHYLLNKLSAVLATKCSIFFLCVCGLVLGRECTVTLSEFVWWQQLLVAAADKTKSSYWLKNRCHILKFIFKSSDIETNHVVPSCLTLIMVTSFIWRLLLDAVFHGALRFITGCEDVIVLYTLWLTGLHCPHTDYCICIFSFINQ